MNTNWPSLRKESACPPVSRAAAWAEGFGRLELIFVITTVAVLAALALPSLAGNWPRFARVHCLSNLRSVGQGFHIWASEHGEENPWRVPAAEGGTHPQSFPMGNNAYAHFMVLSNVLESPRVLVCPADSDRVIARTWGLEPGGFLNTSYRNRALSFLVGVHALPTQTDSVLSGDRTIRFSGRGTCSLGLASVPAVYANDSSVGFASTNHAGQGNLLFNDGRVEQTTSAQMSAAVRNNANLDNGAAHFLAP